jgi:L-ascorbate metabolism protein UlaG (beta-lactamase superfamily)
MPRNRYYSGPISDHFDGERFFGPAGTSDKSLRDLWALSRTPFAAWPPQVAPAPPAPPLSRISGEGLRVTTIGHASHLIQVAGLNLLIDPVWSERASPLSFAGPKRVVAPGLALDALPPIDAVLISHNHYDHLDLATCAALARRHRCRFIVPLGNDSILRRHDASLVVQAYDWGDRTALSADTSVTLLPTYHWSARGLGDRRMALWASFLIATPVGAIYAIGDTAYRDGRIFRDVLWHFGRPRLALIPIGAYAPRWFMKDHHVDPEESAAIFLDCGAHSALAHHWGCFRLTAEPIDEPPQRLAEALAARGVPLERFRVQRPGQVFDVPPIAPR